MPLKLQREFLHLAANMLRCRFHVLHGRPCTRVKWVHYHDDPIDQILCYVGYSDWRSEMRLLCAEALRGALLP